MPTRTSSTNDTQSKSGKVKIDVAPAPAAAPAAAPAKPAQPPVRFMHTLREVHKMVVELDGYGQFLIKYVLLQIVRQCTAFSFLVVVYAMADDLTIEKITGGDLSAGQYAALGCCGVLNIVGRLTPFMMKLAIDKFKEELQSKQATAVVAKLFDLPHKAVASTPTGEFAQLIGKVFRNLDTLLPALYANILPHLIECLIAVFFIGAAYGPIALAQIGLFVVYSFAAFKAAKNKALRNKDLMTAMLTNWGKILAAAESYERAHFFDNVEHELSQAQQAFQMIGGKIFNVASGEHFEAMRLMAISLTILIGFVMLIPVAVNAEGVELAALTFYFVIFLGGLDSYALGISKLRTAVVEYQTFDEFLGRMSDVADADGAVDLPRNANPAIEFKNVSFSYGGRVILDDVSFRIEGGQTLGLVGSSGCGKSTVLRLLLRFYRQTAGTITVDGHDITRVSGRSLRRLFSVVTQDAQLFNGTVRDNIGYGKLGSSDDEIHKAAKLAELALDEHGGDFDLSLDKACGEKGAKLSGGQQQRVSIARAMLKNGTIYLLDEPTTGLDGVVAKQLQKTLDELSSSATTICITHHLEDLQKAHQILYLDQGKIVERGTFAELIAGGGEFAKQVEARKTASANA